jgi:16S rRNA (cytosine1402-N4)-methyltransferase
MMSGCDNLTWGVAGGPARHIPVMLSEVVDALGPVDGETYLDGTFGAGGYTAAILEAAHCNVIALDRDPQAIAAGRTLEEKYSGRLDLVQARFSQMADVARELGHEQVDGIALDIGVSSMQIDQADRGFSFQADGPLDMRMGDEGPTAADVVNWFEEADLARIIWILGEERRSRQIARAILAARDNGPIEGTNQLADIVSKALGGRRGAKRHPATKTFQALRMMVNQELEELARALYAAEAILREGGRLVVVAFHSLEDRIVKQFIATASGTTPGQSRHLPVVEKNTSATFAAKSIRVRKPSKAEVDANPRARSARLRCAVRTDMPARPYDGRPAGLPDLPDIHALIRST